MIGLYVFLAIVAVVVIADIVIFGTKTMPGIPAGDPPQRRRSDKIERTNEILASSAYHREQQEALFQEMCDLHGYRPSGPEADEFLSVIYDGLPYHEAMFRVMQRFPNTAHREQGS